MSTSFSFLDHAILSPSGHSSKRAKRAAQGRHRQACCESLEAIMQIAKGVRSGKIPDQCGYSRKDMIEAENKKTLSNIGGIERQIQFMSSVGMGKRGKIKPSYQRLIEHYRSQIEALRVKIDSNV